MWHLGDGMGWWMVFGTVFELLIVVGVVLLIANYLGARGTDRSFDNPLEIAKRRYARGEITRDQYEQLRRDLDSRVDAS
jgi:putative membrane protein